MQLPGPGSVSGFTGEPADRETFFSFTNFSTPSLIYRLDLQSGESQVFRQPELSFAPSDQSGSRSRQTDFEAH